MLKKYPLFSIPIRNGILGGLLGTILLISLFFLNRHPLLIPEYMDFRIILFVVLILFTLRDYRDFYRNGVLSFWEGMILSLMLTIAFAVVAFFVLWIFGELFPEFVKSYISLETAILRSYPPQEIARIGKLQYELVLKLLPETRAVQLAGIYFGQSFVISFFISIILSVILRRQPKLT